MCFLLKRSVYKYLSGKPALEVLTCCVGENARRERGAEETRRGWKYEEETEAGMGPQVDGGERENGGTVLCEGKDESEAENRESGGIRALISVLGPSRGMKRGALTREILIPC